MTEPKLMLVRIKRIVPMGYREIELLAEVILNGESSEKETVREAGASDAGAELPVQERPARALREEKLHL